MVRAGRAALARAGDLRDVDPPFSARRILWLIARQPEWNDGGRGTDGRRLDWLDCGPGCESMARRCGDPYGCHGLPTRPLSEEYPGRFGDWPIERCPYRLIGEADGQTRELLDLVRDHRAGVLVGWPDRYVAGAVEGVRYVLAEAAAAEAAMLRRR